MARARTLAGVALLAAALSVPLLPTQAAAFHEEGGEGPHLDAGEIQERIDAASPGALIVVPAGTYHGNLTIDVPVTLRGEGRPLLFGDGTGSVVTVTAPDVTMTGLRVANSGVGPVGGPAGIRLEAGADRTTVQDAIVEDTYMGIAVFGARGVRIVDNVVRGREGAVITDEGHVTGGTGEGGEVPTIGGRILRGDGISLWNAEDVLVRDNVVEHARDGIYMSFGTNILLDRNRIAGSRYAIHSMYATDLVVAESVLEDNLSGAVMMYGGPVLLLRNEIRGSSSPSTGFGILLKDVFGCEAVENVLVGNRIGVQIDGPATEGERGIVIHGNTIALNQFGVSLYPSARATFYRNSFVENTVQVVAQGHGVAGKNTWSHDGVGNYWSGYRGYDLAGEGVGDMPHMEGGTVEQLMVRAPVLQALASGPAFGLLRAVEDRWVEHEPVVVDHLPLMRPASPSLEDGVTGGSATAVTAGVGVAALFLAGAVLMSFRRPIGRGRASRVRA